MRLRLMLVSAACALVASLVPAAASAQPRMLIGFQDDPSLRWRDDRAAVFDIAQSAHAGIVRTTVYWSRIAETKPASAINPFDPAYHFDDLDEFVRNAGLHGMEVMLTIWGTPAWANSGKGQNFAPTNAAALQNFARALATRYSGRFAGLPFVRYYTVWNESNLGQFLSPQYTSKGVPAAPAIYAKIYRAAYAGIKLGNPRALVGIGETSARGRDKFLGRAGTQETESPGRFAELLSKQPGLKFDAWSHHPYPTAINAPPTQNVRWPNVTLTQLPRFEKSLDTWFKRKDIPIWITEYGHETRPEEPKGVTYAQQQAYVRQALTIAAKDPRVQMFIWFILRDDPTSAWQSGLVERDGVRKPGFRTFASLAATLDGRDPELFVKAGTTNPLAKFAALELWSRSGTGASVGLTIAVYDNGRVVKTAQPASTIGSDGWISFRVPIKTAKGHTYQVTIAAVDINGNRVDRSVLLRVA
ncbi:MAG TPA: cellulase family glycosylhydrolase [Gaiellaceae bacterium]|nr:cellulase family glycosylhydrolase [Gaiellaceae bacterium]